jgi:hypothetical protein
MKPVQSFYASLHEWMLQQALSRVMARLEKAVHKSVLRLSANDCALLLETLREKPKRGRPHVSWEKTMEIALWSVAHEANGCSIRKAVEATARELKVSENTVWNARRAFGGNAPNK